MAAGFREFNQFGWHLKSVRCYKREVERIQKRHDFDERVDRPPVSKVADDRDLESFDLLDGRLGFFLHGVEIEERLRRMFAGAIARVDDWDVRRRGELVDLPDLWMSDHHHVDIAAHNA